MYNGYIYWFVQSQIGDIISDFNIILDKSSELLSAGTANKFGKQKLKTNIFAANVYW